MDAMFAQAMSYHRYGYIVTVFASLETYTCSIPILYEKLLLCFASPN